MAKNYFPHDYYARGELRDLRMKFGMEGYGFYWAFVEILHESGGTVKLKELDAIAFDLKMNVGLCEKIIRESGLFVIKNGKITSQRVLRNIRKMEELSDIRRAAVNVRWTDQEDPPGEESPGEVILPIYAGLTYADTLRNFKEWFSDRMDLLESDAADDDPIWQVRGYLENIIDSVCSASRVTVEGRRVMSVDYLGVIQFYVQSRKNLDVLVRIIADVNDRSVSGKIRNKKNYLISALYQGVKSEGG